MTYPVGLITADEIVAAGSGSYTASGNKSYYLYKENWYWSFSPYGMNSSNNSAYVFDIFSSGNLNANFTSGSGAVAPVINLKAEYLDKFQGDGTIDNPYYLADLD